MADITIRNRSVGTVTGTAADRLTFIYDTQTNDVWLNGMVPAATGAEAPPLTGYAGRFDGMGGNDCSFAGFGHLTFVDLSGGNDSIVSGDGDDSLAGGDGNDSLYGWGGRDTIDGGAGVDRAQMNLGWFAGNVVVDLNGASALADGAVLRNVEVIDITTAGGNDRITGHRSALGNDRIWTGAGNDTIRMSLGSTDEVAGGTGQDVLDVICPEGRGNVWLTNLVADAGGGYSGRFDGLGGNDLGFTGIERFRFVDQAQGDDIIHTGRGNDTLLGGGGNDTLRSGSGADRINGGAGDRDFWQGDLSGVGSDVVINLNRLSAPRPGASVTGIEGMDVTTGRGNDSLTVHRNASMNDVLSGGAGNDTLSFWDGATDAAHGGAGQDLLRLTWKGATNDVWLTDLVADAGGGYSGRFNGMGGNDLGFTGIERFAFTDLSGGNDIIRTGAGNDTLLGGGGNDLLDSGSGIDRVNGGAGLDTWQADLGQVAAAITIDLNAPSTYRGSGRVAQIEGLHLTTGRGADRITGHRDAGLSDTISTGAGADVIRLHAGGTDRVTGGTGVDTLILTYAVATNDVWLRGLTASDDGGWSGMFNGMGGTDVLFSGIERFSFTDLSGGNDIIETATGADTISGGMGNDDLTGGLGDDQFVYDRTRHEGADILRDFGAGADRIVLSGGSMADVQITAVNNGADARITLGSGTSLLLLGVDAGSLGAEDFIFG